MRMPYLTICSVQRLKYDAVTDLIPGIWSLKRSKRVSDEDVQNEISATFRHLQKRCLVHPTSTQCNLDKNVFSLSLLSLSISDAALRGK
ncbi:hypothetical protein J6590_094143 [Homalodisca vitripennis]|nr:hypothetical protein J6590_094143 [Homalodisca vitripennis]